MNTVFIKTVSWSKFVIALVFLSSIFGLSAMAQDKPLDAKSRTALIAELKGVIARAEPDEKKSAMVARKWDARKDLTGKTKTQIINLLYKDVKSVITDSGTQYEISSMLSMYKQMPDESFSGQTKSTSGATSKSEAVKMLVDLTFDSHPYVGIEAELAKLPGIKDAEAAKAEDRKNRVEGFDAALKTNNQLTADQKAFVRANYDRLIKMTDKITEDAINKNFPTEQWIKEGLSQSYSKDFTAKELVDLNAYFQSPEGRQVLKYIRQTKMAALITGNGGKPDFTAQDKAEHDKFAATATGKKFVAAYITEAKAFEQRKENEAYSKPDADGFAIYEPANLNKLFNQFVKDNYKK